MGWMNDTLSYFQTPYNKRADNYNLLTFPALYAFNEKYILPLSHDEVVHGKKSLIEKQQGSYEEKFYSLKVLAMLQYAFPGKKLSFMGNELAQFIEWRFYQSLDWLLLDYPVHRGHKNFIKRLNLLYAANPALYQNDYDGKGFDFIQAKDKGGVIAFIRKGREQEILCLFNASKEGKKGYILPLSYGDWKLVLSSCARAPKHIKSKEGRVVISLPPLCGAYYIKND
jgi:1,4-alpha-glucan branching enzyme